MRVALINPRMFKHVYHFFPIGLGCMAGALKKHGIEFGWYDQRLENWSTPELIKELKEGPRFDCFGITGLISSFQYVKEICHALKVAFPDTPIVVGGKQSSINPEILLGQTGADYIIHGDGEEPLVMLLEMLCGERLRPVEREGARPSTIAKGVGLAVLEEPQLATMAPSTIPGLIYRDESGEVQQNGMAQLKTIDEYHLPLRDLPMERYVSRDGIQSNGLKSINLISTRGCPFECSFCNFSDGISGKPMREYNADHMEEDLAYLKESFGLQHVFYNDDIFALNTKRLTAMGEIHRRLGIKYTISMRLDLISEEKIRILEETGCKVVLVGVESASPTILKYIDKDLDLDVYQKNIDALQSSKLTVSFNFIAGYIGETEQTMDETYQFCLKNRILFTPFFATAYPGTKLFDMVKERVGIDDEADYMIQLSKTDLQNDYVINMSDMSEKDLRKCRDKMIVGSALNCLTRNRFLHLLLGPAFSLYWGVIKANNNRIAWLRKLTDLFNWTVVKPLFKLVRHLDSKGSKHTAYQSSALKN